MTLLQILVVLAVVAAVAAVAAGVLRGGADEVGLPEPTTTIPPVHLPADRVTAKDVDRVRFSAGFRGYRMDEVDQVLDRLSGELRAREAEVAELRERLRGSEETPVEDVATRSGSDQDGGEL